MVDDGASQNARERFDSRNRLYAARGYDRLETARFVASVLAPQGPAPVLDVGTGKGLLAVSLASRGATVVSVDPDSADLELATVLSREAGVTDRVAFVTADAAALPYPDDHFGAAATLDALHHLTDPEPVFREVARALSPHGELLVADFSREGLDLIARIHEEEGRTHPDSGVGIDDAAGVLHRLGFEPVVRLTRHLHDIAVFARSRNGIEQDTLIHTRRASHPHCLVCGHENPSGLHLMFTAQPDRSVHATFRGGFAYQGYPDAMHGGLVATLIESAMTNCLFSMGVVAEVMKLEIKYQSPARWYQPCHVSGALTRSTQRMHYLTASVRQDGRVVAQGWATFVVRRQG